MSSESTKTLKQEQKIKNWQSEIEGITCTDRTQGHVFTNQKRLKM